MRTSIAIAAFLSSATTFSLELPSATFSPTSIQATVTSQPPAPLDEANAVKLEARQATVHNPTPSPVAPVQAPTVTTEWVETFINGQTTYVQMIYTQTFPSVYEPYPAPLSGQIGLGTLTKEKRDASQPTAYLIPMELVLQTVNIIEPIQPVLQVEVVQPVTVAMVSLVSAVPSSGSMVSFMRSISRQTGVAGTASMTYRNGSAGASRTFMAGLTAGIGRNGSFTGTI